MPEIPTRPIHPVLTPELPPADLTAAGDMVAWDSDFDLDVSTVPIGESPTSRRIVDSGTYTCTTQSCCTSNACH